MPERGGAPQPTTLLPPEIGALGPDELFVNELFHSIQGESTHAGRPCFFIRLAGCHLRCVWCDSEHAFHEGRVLSIDRCVEAALASGARLVEVTGGEPLLQKSVHKLLARLADAGLEVLLETSGALPIDRVDERVRRILDWKCPGSGMAERNDPRAIAALRSGDELKLVVRDRADYLWARAWLAEARPRLPAGLPVHISPVHLPPGVEGSLDPRDLAAWILEDQLASRLDVRLGLQIHKWIWGADVRGV